MKTKIRRTKADVRVSMGFTPRTQSNTNQTPTSHNSRVHDCNDEVPSASEPNTAVPNTSAQGGSLAFDDPTLQQVALDCGYNRVIRESPHTLHPHLYLSCTYLVSSVIAGFIPGVVQTLNYVHLPMMVLYSRGATGSQEEMHQRLIDFNVNHSATVLQQRDEITRVTNCGI